MGGRLKALFPRVIGLALLVMLPSGALAAESFEAALYRAWNADDQAPEKLLQQIDEMLVPPGIDPDRAARLKLVARGIVLAERGSVDGARQVIESLKLRAQGDPVAKGDVLLVESLIDHREHRAADGYRHAREADRAYESLCAVSLKPCDYRYWSLAMERLIVGAQNADNLAQAALQADALAALARRAHDKAYEAFAELDLANIAMQASDEAKTDRLVARARVLATASGQARAILAVGTFEGLVFQKKKDFASARDAAQRMLAVAVGANRQQDTMLIRVNLGEAYVKLHEPTKAAEQYEEALTWARRQDARAFEIYVLSDLIEAEAAEGRLDLARRDVAGIRPLMARYAPQPRRLGTLKDLAAVLDSAGAKADALDLLQEAQAVAFSTGSMAGLLRDQAMQQSASAAARQASQRNWSAAAGAGLLTALVAALFAYRLRARNIRLKSSHEALLQRADHDPLTGLLNRRHLETLAGRKEAFAGVLYLIDLDHFKRINDTLGHPAGDAVLVEVAKRLERVIREGDTAVRWGGEEFVVHVSRMSTEESDLLATRLLESLAGAPVQFGDREVAISASIGYCRFPLLAEEGSHAAFDDAFGLVDAAMYRSKVGGRNRASGLRNVRLGDLGRLVEDLEGAVEERLVEVVTLVGPSKPAALQVSTETADVATAS